MLKLLKMYITLHFSLYYTKEKMKCHSNLTFSGGITWITDNVFAICGRMQIRRRLRLQNTLVLLRPCTLVMNVEPMRCRSVIWLLCASTIRSLQTISSDLPTEKSLCPLTLPEKNNKSVTDILKRKNSYGFVIFVRKCQKDFSPSSYLTCVYELCVVYLSRYFFASFSEI